MKIHKLVVAAFRGNTWFSVQGIKELQRRDLLWVAWLAFAGIAVVAGFFIFYIIDMYRNLLLLGIQTGQYELLFFYATLGSWVFIFLMGIPLALSIMYYARDVQLLMALPLKPGEIIISRVVLLLLYCFPLHLFLTGFAAYVYGNAIAYSFELLFSACIHILAGALFPLSLAILFVVMLTRIINVKAFKTAFEVGGMFLSLAIIVIFNILVSRSFMDPDYISSLDGITQLFKQFMNIAFPAEWVARSFLPGRGFLYLLPSLGLYLFAAGLMILVTGKTYLQDISNRIVVSRKKTPRVKEKTGFRKQAVTVALIRKELHVLFSNSTFIFQTIGELCIFPILLVLFVFILPGNYVKELARFLPAGQLMSLIIFGICVALTCLNSLSSTSLSREGTTFALSLIIPVPGKTHMISKLVLYILFYFPVFIIDMIILMFFLKSDVLSLVYMIPGALAFLVFAFIINITIDLIRPVLKWTHPMQAVKNNLNVLISLGISFGYLAIFGFSGWAFLWFLNLPPVLFGTGIVLLTGIADILLLPLLFQFAEKRYNGGIEMC
ncbi:MAG: hypothetical protein JXB88_03365 [Spirochaetales bacterium]|nr:hypothetical protein [Spirochaetales bacterium]